MSCPYDSLLTRFEMCNSDSISERLAANEALVFTNVVWY